MKEKRMDGRMKEGKAESERRLINDIMLEIFIPLPCFLLPINTALFSTSASSTAKIARPSLSLPSLSCSPGSALSGVPLSRASNTDCQCCRSCNTRLLSAHLVGNANSFHRHQNQHCKSCSLRNATELFVHSS